jgi:hypothetical protein
MLPKLRARGCGSSMTYINRSLNHIDAQLCVRLQHYAIFENYGV